MPSNYDRTIRYSYDDIYKTKTFIVNGDALRAKMSTLAEYKITTLEQLVSQISTYTELNRCYAFIIFSKTVQVNIVPESERVRLLVAENLKEVDDLHNELVLSLARRRGTEAVVAVGVSSATKTYANLKGVECLSIKSYITMVAQGEAPYQNRLDSSINKKNIGPLHYKPSKVGVEKVKDTQSEVDGSILNPILSKWFVSNFKPIGKPADLDFGAVTILCGVNSVGKSSLIQSILMIAQTLADNETDAELILNGELIKMGRANDIWHGGKEDENIQIRFEVQSGNLNKTISVRSAFMLNQGDDNKTTEKLLWTEIHSTPKAMNPNPEGSPNEDDLMLFHANEESPHLTGKTFQITNVSGKSKQDWSKYLISQPWNQYLQQPIDLKDCSILTDHFLPGSIMLPVSGEEKDLANIFTMTKEIINSYKDIKNKINYYQQLGNIPNNSREIIQEFCIKHVYKEPLTTLDYQAYIEILMSLSKNDKDKLLQYLKDNMEKSFSTKQTKANIFSELQEHAPLPATISTAVKEVKDFFTKKIFYLGALRIEPSIISDVTSSNPWGKYVGVHGEKIGQALDAYKTISINYINPFTGNISNEPFHAALQVWMDYMELTEQVSSTDLGKIGYRIELEDNYAHKKLDLTSVGFGISQVLPVLVTGLLMPPGSLLIVEQPEVHLHPKAQSQLADFFISMGRLGKQVIVETHSDHLTNRVIRRIAESDSQDLLPSIKIFFAEKEKGETVFREIHLNQYGMIEDWPSGFFDQNALEAQAILMASMNKRKQKLIQSKGQ